MAVVVVVVAVVFKKMEGGLRINFCLLRVRTSLFSIYIDKVAEGIESLSDTQWFFYLFSLGNKILIQKGGWRE